MSKSSHITSDSQQPVTTRKACTSDATNIAKLGVHVFTITFGHSVPSQELQAYLDKSYSIGTIAEDLEDPMKDIIVATDQSGKILGFAYLTRNTSEPCVADLADKVELQRIYVDPAAHGKGIGSLLVRSIEEIARKRGFRNIWLGVWEENYKAQKAYERWGYQRVGKHDFVLGTVVQTDHIMAKSL
ncbi:acyl-CoA N-acyltransferase [Lipomyces tetrasporus]|uniref:Acyl-CoA N-acyltransferase n=1 Tax=Lipomyces tetrasporus TaxID=54092 RepID=A0AAD7QQB0_9ASCO|nr:acyl-CoA N-acyltransferase [Lipomyces tetrasporus]KAJ8099348.1 acyl-CoA N-acyltransferase [Lipomyces tetrasporus]